MWAVEPVWIREDVVLAIHARLIAEHGGLEGLRDSALLSSALARPRNLLAYSSQPPDVAALCAAYAFGLCQNHPFLDGNKRIALVVTRLFATMNGSELETSQAEKYQALMRLASGEWNEADYAEWIRNRLRLKE
ncbi:MAG TPA: type II toxin-antitoxin system death-on-curing family toxin [Armatimonadota bacterium]|nr:type II toxin-antitoxin system death-on-curing family toxin [Armatimonadota bacterium]